MLTSSSQFQLLVEYMERNGDLSKPTEGPQGRATNIQRWTELTELLNADATGDTKTAEKWRKEEVIELPPPSDTRNFPINIQHCQESHDTAEDWIRPGTSSQPPLFFPPMHVASTNERELSLVGSGCPEASGPATNAREPLASESETDLPVVDSAPPAARAVVPSVLRSSSARRCMLQSPTPLPLTPRRRRRGQEPSSPLRRRTCTHTQSELARQAFVRSDCEWWAFQQETERERHRLREIELGQQQQWLDVFSQLIALGNRYADILEKK